MKKIILAAAIVGLSMGGALAQTTGPSGQDNMKKNDTMSKDGMKKDGMSKEGTTGMNKDSMKKDGMKKDTSMDNKPVDGGMKK